jgi:hypothetical protein
MAPTELNKKCSKHHSTATSLEDADAAAEHRLPAADDGAKAGQAVP